MHIEKFPATNIPTLWMNWCYNFLNVIFCSLVSAPGWVVVLSGQLGCKICPKLCNHQLPYKCPLLHSNNTSWTCSYVVLLLRTDQLQRIKQNVQSFLELERYLLNIARQDNDLLQCFLRCFLVSTAQSRAVSSNCVLGSRLLNKGSLPLSSLSYTRCHF